jgi:signal transduction histidine kinase/ligand-binding sensor domain-containing protein
VKIVRSLSICMLLASFAAVSGALDPRTHVTQYAHTAWRLQDGFFSGAPLAFAQTTDGYLWIGTEAGLLRFDGVRFVPWTPPEGSMLQPSTGVYSLLATMDGSLWIGTGANLFRFKDDKLTVYTNATGRFNSIVEDRNGIVWVARTRTSDGAGPLCQVIEAKLRCYGKSDGIPYPYGQTLIKDFEGNLWLAGEKEVSRWQPGSTTTYAVEGLRSAEGQSGELALAAKPNGGLWVGTNRHGPGLGLQQWMQGASKPFSTPEFDSSTLEISTLYLDRENSLWVGTGNNGIYRIHDEEVDRFNTADGLSSDQISGFFEDREGDMWVATSKGIDCFRDLQVATYSRREGLTADRVASVSVSRHGTVWIGNNGGLDSLREGAISSIGEKAGFPGHRLTVLYEDHDGLLWVGVDNGLYVYENGKFNALRRPDGSPIGMTIAITGDSDNNIWAEITGQPPKLLRIQNRKIQEEIPAPQIPQASSLAADLQSGIWLGLVNGALARYRNGQLESFSTFSLGKHILIPSVLVNSDGSVFGGSSSGLVEWRNGKVQTLTTRNGLPCDRINAAIFDSQNALWLYMQCGLVRIAAGELSKWWEHPDTVIEFRLFDALDGVRASPSSFSPRAARSSDGRLWFANGNVLQTIDPDHLLHNSIAPPVHIEAVKADGKDYLSLEKLRLPPLVRNIEIDYTALSFKLPQRVLFRYKLEGHDTDWQQPGARRQAFYTDLKPGQYRFQVIACNNDGVWNDTGATFILNIAPAWFQTTWFRLCGVAAFLLLLWAAYLYRVRQLESQFAAGVETRVDERTRIARELHDTLLQSFQGAVFQFQAARRLLLRNADNAMQVVDEAIQAAEEGITEGRAAIHDLRPEPAAQRDLPELLNAAARELEAAQELNKTSPSFRVTIEGTERNLALLVQDEVYRIAREVIRNAFHHAAASHIEVEIRYDQDRLRLRIRDNGKGIDAKVLEAGGLAGHWGILGIRERAKRIGSRLDFWSEAGAGTEVQLTVPAAVAYKKPQHARRFRLFPRAGGDE